MGTDYSDGSIHTTGQVEICRPYIVCCSLCYLYCAGLRKQMIIAMKLLRVLLPSFRRCIQLISSKEANGWIGTTLQVRGRQRMHLLFTGLVDLIVCLECIKTSKNFLCSTAKSYPVPYIWRVALNLRWKFIVEGKCCRLQDNGEYCPLQTQPERRGDNFNGWGDAQQKVDIPRVALKMTYRKVGKRKWKNSAREPKINEDDSIQNSHDSLRLFCTRFSR